MASAGASAGLVQGLLKTRAPANHHYHNSKTQPQEAKHPGRRPAAAQPRGAFSLADKQTAKRSRNASARFQARPLRVFSVFFEQRRRRRSPLGVVHY